MDTETNVSVITIVYNDELKVLESLRKDAASRGLDVPFAVVDAHQHAHTRRGPAHGRTLLTAARQASDQKPRPRGRGSTPLSRRSKRHR